MKVVALSLPLESAEFHSPARSGISQPTDSATGEHALSYQIGDQVLLQHNGAFSKVDLQYESDDFQRGLVRKFRVWRDSVVTL